MRVSINAGTQTGRQPQVVQATPDDPYGKLLATPRVLASLLAVVLLTFFFMVYGENLQRNAIALLPGRQQKKFTVEILHSIEREVSRYVLTISIINTVVRLISMRSNWSGWTPMLLKDGQWRPDKLRSATVVI